MTVALEGLLTPPQVAKRAGVSRSTVFYSMRDGRLPVVVIAGCAFVPAEAAERFAAAPRHLSKSKRS